MGVNSISVGGSFNNYNGLSCGKQGGDIEIKDRERESGEEWSEREKENQI